MIRAELWKKGDPTNKTLLGVAYIKNSGGSGTVGEYLYQITKIGSEQTNWKTGTIKGFPRKRFGVWDLLYRALKEIVGDRND